MEKPVVTDKHFREWEQVTFGYGYGTGELHILPILHAFFAALEDGSAYNASHFVAQWGGAVTWLLLNALLHGGILEYGTSPRYGWLTPQGERLREYVLSKTPKDLYDIATMDVDYDHPLCSRSFCNCPDGSDTQGCRHNPLFREYVADASLAHSG